MTYLRVVFSVLILSLSPGVWASQACLFDLSLENIAPDGSLLTLSNASIMKVKAGGKMAVSSWHHGDTLLVCPEKVVDLSDNLSEVLIDNG